MVLFASLLIGKPLNILAVGALSSAQVTTPRDSARGDLAEDAGLDRGRHAEPPGWFLDWKYRVKILHGCENAKRGAGHSAIMFSVKSPQMDNMNHSAAVYLGKFQGYAERMKSY
jgi:hypothetical protein